MLFQYHFYGMVGVMLEETFHIAQNRAILRILAWLMSCMLNKQSFGVRDFSAAENTWSTHHCEAKSGTRYIVYDFYLHFRIPIWIFFHTIYHVMSCHDMSCQTTSKSIQSIVGSVIVNYCFGARGCLGIQFKISLKFHLRQLPFQCGEIVTWQYRMAYNILASL